MYSEYIIAILVLKAKIMKARLLEMIHMMWRRGLWIILSGGRVWDALEKG
jgi:hypothetical protein